MKRFQIISMVFTVGPEWPVRVNTIIHSFQGYVNHYIQSYPQYLLWGLVDRIGESCYNSSAGGYLGLTQFRAGTTTFQAINHKKRPTVTLRKNCRPLMLYFYWYLRVYSNSSMGSKKEQTLEVFSDSTLPILKTSCLHLCYGYSQLL